MFDSTSFSGYQYILSYVNHNWLAAMWQSEPVAHWPGVEYHTQTVNVYEMFIAEVNHIYVAMIYVRLHSYN